MTNPNIIFHNSLSIFSPSTIPYSLTRNVKSMIIFPSKNNTAGYEYIIMEICPIHYATIWTKLNIMSNFNILPFKSGMIPHCVQ